MALTSASRRRGISSGAKPLSVRISDSFYHTMLIWLMMLKAHLPSPRLSRPWPLPFDAAFSIYQKKDIWTITATWKAFEKNAYFKMTTAAPALVEVFMKTKPKKNDVIVGGRYRLPTFQDLLTGFPYSRAFYVVASYAESARTGQRRVASSVESVGKSSACFAVPLVFVG